MVRLYLRGDAGSGESNIRRYIIENDYLEAIAQLPQNLFYNTGISTYVWILSNNKTPERKGKVQLIDASNLYRKLRKNLGAKNCEFAPEDIETITNIYLTLRDDDNQNNESLSNSKCISKVFNNQDFGFYKVTVERPLKLMAQCTPERVASLRFINTISEPMEWVYNHFGDKVYQDLKAHEKEIKDYLEKEEISITPANLKSLLSQKKWLEQKELMDRAGQIVNHLNTTTGINNSDKIWTDFNFFSQQVDKAIKQLNIKLSASQKKQFLGAVSWVDESAEKVIKKVHKLKKDKLEELLNQLGTTKENLANFGYFPTDKPDVYVEYESDTNLRDTENIPLNYRPSFSTMVSQDVSYSASGDKGLNTSTFVDRVAIVEGYFLDEVRPHVEDAWLDMSKTVIGYEISFNKYFYQHQPLRSLQEVSKEMLDLEAQTEGLLKNLVSF